MAMALSAIFIYLLFIIVLMCGFMALFYWAIFTKAGEAGWKSLIPIYNIYILYKISWIPSMYILFLVCTAFGSMFTYIGGPTAMIGSILSLVTGIISIMQFYKLSRAFGHGIGFTIGLTFLNPIFLLILGFGKSQYLGPQ